MKNYTNLVKYKRLAPFYDQLMGNRIFDKARKRAFQVVGFQPNDRVLMVGIGTGQDLLFLPKGIQVTGVDLSREMLERAKEKIEMPTVELLEMNAEQLLFKENIFDVVVLNLILSVVENPQVALKEAWRVLKDKGKILIFDKFLPKDEKPSLVRKLANMITSSVGTDINRQFEEITDGLPLTVVHNEPSIFSGSYRIIVLEKEIWFQENN